jgi:hypothetical protein
MSEIPGIGQVSGTASPDMSGATDALLAMVCA